MNFQLKCRNHTDCPDELKAAIRDKVERFVNLVPETAYMEIELQELAHPRANGNKEAEVILDLPGVKPVMRFAAEGETFLEAVDRILDNLDEELTQFKARARDHSHHGPAVKEQVADVVNEEEL